MLGRLLALTITTPDLPASTAAYQRYLGYRVADDGAIGRDAARAWGRVPMASARAVLMEPASGADTYLRFVEGPAYLGYQPFACLGWNAAQLIVKDVDQLAAELRGGPFQIIGPPASPSFSDRIRTLQVVGPSREVLCLTEIESKLPIWDAPDAACLVDRAFGVILGGASLEGLRDCYEQGRGLGGVAAVPTALSAFSAPYALPSEHPHVTAALPLPGQCRIEADQMPSTATARPCEPGQLPPGLAMVSFEVDRLPETLPGALGGIHCSRGLPYSGRRSRAGVGPAGELIELIEVA